MCVNLSISRTEKLEEYFLLSLHIACVLIFVQGPRSLLSEDCVVKSSLCCDEEPSSSPSSPPSKVLSETAAGLQPAAGGGRPSRAFNPAAAAVTPAVVCVAMPLTPRLLLALLLLLRLPPPRRPSPGRVVDLGGARVAVVIHGRGRIGRVKHVGGYALSSHVTPRYEIRMGSAPFQRHTQRPTPCSPPGSRRVADDTCRCQLSSRVRIRP